MLDSVQLALRKDRVTGSTVSAYLGVNPYDSPLDAWEVNEGLRTVEENDLMRMGNLLEPALAREGVRRLGWTDYEYPAPTLVHPDQADWWAATPDVLALGGLNSGIQIKCHQPWMAKSYGGQAGCTGEWGNEVVPLHHLMQCQWEMAVLGAEIWWLGVFFHIGDYRLYRISRDENLLSAMQERAHAFWRTHLDPHGPKQRPEGVPWTPEVSKPKPKPRLSDDQWMSSPPAI